MVVRRLTDIERRVSQVTRSMWMEGSGGKPGGKPENETKEEHREESSPPASAAPAVAGPARKESPSAPDNQPIGAEVRTNPSPGHGHEDKHSDQQKKVSQPRTKDAETRTKTLTIRTPEEYAAFGGSTHSR